MKKSASAAPDTPAPSFSSLGLDPRLVEALTGLGYEEPTEIQAQAIPVLLSGRDLVGQAATGTGKTAAFALPLLQQLAASDRKRGAPGALILVPTRELAMQVAEAVHRYGRALGITALPIYGGASMDGQLRSLKRGVDVVVATPGRALDHLQRKTLKLDSLAVVVLDEADEMMDMGFAEDLEAILAATPSSRQTVLFSATLAPRVVAIAGKYLRDPVRVTIAHAPRPASEAPQVRQEAYIVARAHKIAALGRVLDVEQPASAMIFCRTRTEVDELTEKLSARGLRASSLHGGHNQQQRDRVMAAFRGRSTELLVATDVAARGLDVKHVSHVINYDVPAAAESYVHRIGRTGRAGREGVAITFAEPREHRLLRNIEAEIRQKITVKPVPTLADMRTRRLEALQSRLRDTIIEGNLDSVRVVVESLAEEYDIMDVAAAAVRQLMTGDDADTVEEIPSGIPTASGKASSGKVRREVSGTRERVFIGGGRKLKIRPGDIVGAIVTHTQLDARSLGTITILDRHSLIDVPADSAQMVVDAVGKFGIKGKKLTVRRDSKHR
ncbi:MAG: DEAD/DEAH box helicase [Cytophagaceae bacterium]|nr:DEAD/DEAH box helicase [Gemmatimonadaceae bacterium]